MLRWTLFFLRKWGSWLWGTGLALLMGANLVLAQELTLEQLPQEVQQLRATLQTKEQELTYLKNLLGELRNKVTDLEERAPKTTIDALLEEQTKLTQELHRQNQELQTLQQKLEQIATAVPAPASAENAVSSSASEDVAWMKQLLLGLLAVQSQNASELAEQWTPLLQQGLTAPVSIEALLLVLGENFSRQELYEPAANYYGTLIQQFPESPYRPRAMLGLAQVFGNQKDIEKQKIILEAFLQAYPEDSQVKNVQATLKKLPKVKPSSSGASTVSQEAKPHSEVTSATTTNTTKASKEAPKAKTKAETPATTTSAIASPIPVPAEKIKETSAESTSTNASPLPEAASPPETQKPLESQANTPPTLETPPPTSGTPVESPKLETAPLVDSASKTTETTKPPEASTTQTP